MGFFVEITAEGEAVHRAEGWTYEPWRRPKKMPFCHVGVSVSGRTTARAIDRLGVPLLTEPLCLMTSARAASAHSSLKLYLPRIAPP